VAVTDDGAPFMVTDAQALIGEQAPVGGGNCRHAALVAVAAFDQAVNAGLVEAMAAKELNHGWNAIVSDLLDDQMCGEVFTLRNPQPGAGFLLEPGGQAEMVGMAVGDDGACQPPSSQRRLPGLLDRILGEAGIDCGVAIAVGQQPGVDVVQRKRQRHAQPFHTRRELHRHAGSRRGLVGIGDGSVQVASLCIVEGNLLKLAVGDLPFYPIFSALCAVQHLSPEACSHERNADHYRVGA
jgi:hypothetical protein